MLLAMSLTVVRVCGAWVMGVGLVLSAPSILGAQGGAQPARPAGVAASAGAVARGEYLATKVAMCVQCHSGRDQRGELIESEKFKGGPVPVQSPWPNKKFAYQAPNLAGLPGLTDEQVVMLLTTGQAPGRRAPNPPMPPFRLEKADAEAIVAFLRTR